MWRFVFLFSWCVMEVNLADSFVLLRKNLEQFPDGILSSECVCVCVCVFVSCPLSAGRLKVRAEACWCV